MSLWQNFKEADHYFEKRFFGGIALMALGMCFFFIVDKIFEHVPPVAKILFLKDGKLLLYFIVGLIVVIVVNGSIYYRSLDFFEAETKASVRASVINAVIWTIFWVVWSIILAWITLNNKPLTTLVQAIIIVLAVVPGFIAFFISIKIRQQQMADEEENKRRLGAAYYKTKPNTICLARKYYSGYYGLLCLPVYLISLVVGYLFQMV